MTQRLDECKTATMQLYESDKVYEPGVLHGFGAMCGKQLMDYTYVFMWRPLTDKELSGAAADAGKEQRRDVENGDTDDASNRQRREEVCRNIVAHVKKGNLELVKQSCRTYMDLLAEAQSADAAAPPSPPRTRSAAHIRAPAEVRSLELYAESNAGPLQQGHDGAVLPSAQLPSWADGTADTAAAVTVAAPRTSSAAVVRSAFVMKSGELLTSLAIKVDNCDPDLVLFLVSQGAEVNSEVLSYILANIKELPSCGYASISHLMLSYIWHQRNPIACAMVMAQHLLDISSQHTTKTKEFGELGYKLRKLAACLVEKLERLVGSSASIKLDEEEGDGAEEQDEEGETAQPTMTGARVGPGRSLSGTSASKAEQGKTTSLEDVLAPRGVPLSINDAQPMQVAYDTQDDEFMSTGVVQVSTARPTGREHRKAHWQGAAYQANALVEVHGDSAVHMRDNRMVFKLFNNAGFVGSLGEPIMLAFSRMAHVLILSCRPYYESPRGRWAFRMMCEGILLYVFHAVQLMQSEDGITWQHLLLTLYVLSMVVDEAQEVAHKYQRRLAVYFTDGFNIIEAITILLLLGSGGCKVGMLIAGISNPTWDQLRTAKDFLFNTTAIFLWLRALQVLLPLVGGLGALLMVTSKMVWEVLKFAVLGMMVMMGVAFTMYGMYKERGVPAMDSFANVLLLLFRTFLGETMFDVMLTEKSTLYNLYGNIVVLVYTLAATVILANLLIAIISYHFKPEKVVPQSKFQDAEILKQYEYRVTHHLLGAPFSLPLLLAKAMLPSGIRCMLDADAATFMFSIGIVNLDANPILGESAESTYFATGSAELPYLIFLLTFYPMLMAATWALGLGMAPYCVFYFAVKGCNAWLPAGLESLTTPWMLASKAGGKGSTKGVRGVPAAAAGAADNSSKVAPSDHQDVLQLLDALDEDDWDRTVEGPQNQGRLAQGAVQMLHLGLLLPQCVLFVAARLVMAAVGTLIYVGILVVFCTVVWLGIYQWLARICFSCFWVLRGWMQGWFGGFHTPEGDGRAGSGNGRRGQQPGSSASAAAGALAGRTSTHVLDKRWVRANQAALKDHGQVLTKDEIRAAMLEAGFAEDFVSAATSGPVQ
ncbi:hypothetical protein HXX76_002809 [Chlamydomonas incerta]|uniref:Ion transport domain-containing protein n=1 Tax=Chlamydomonas incerta TaxID=51695 RepID=A0A835TFE6_CHLIN|nr:hypothetical protein HXX76_002809 [Chlamydomonas incerta]|eukprot:KAG2442727.1 hypothetical protein HXX76_002809 [Chlamydomonas incerta]